MTQPTEGFGDAEPFVMLGEMRTCNGTTVAGGYIAHSRRCPLHGDVATAPALLDPVNPGADLAAAEARGYRKAITALREGAKSKLIPTEKAAALGEAVGWLETYLEAIAEEDKP